MIETECRHGRSPMNKTSKSVEEDGSKHEYKYKQFTYIDL